MSRSGASRICVLLAAGAALIVALLICATPALAGNVRPERVEIGVYLIDVAQLDIADGTYSVNFYLQFRCRGPCDPSPTRFEVVNGRARMSRLQDDRPGFKVFHVVADLNASFDLRRYPFEQLTLPIEIEDSVASKRDLVYVASPGLSGIDADAVVAGRRPTAAREAVLTHNYPVFNQSYSRFVFSVTLRKPLAAPVLQALVPAFIIIVTGLIALGLGVEHIAERLIATTSALVAAVLFHLYLANALPPLGYLTFADRYMIINYFVLGLAVASTAAALVFHRRGADERSVRLDRAVLVTSGVLWITLQVANALNQF